MSKANCVLLLACCIVFPVLFYSASQLNPSCPNEAIQWGAGTPLDQQQEYLKRTSSQKGLSTLAQTDHDRGVETPSKPTRPAKSTSSEATQIAYESALKLQYALDSTDIHLEDPHLFSIGRYLNTFTAYLDAILSDRSIDQQPFHKLRRKFFPWWFPSTGLAYLPWERREGPTTGIVLTVGEGNFVLAAHCIQTLRTVVNSTLPIEIFYAGDDDLPEAKREEIKAPLLETINLLDQFNETIAGLRNSGFAMKPFAALASSFQRVILIDADTIFLQKPDAYFDEHAGLNATGIHYFHDRAFHGRKTIDWIKTLMQDSEPSATLNDSMFWHYELEHQQESGVVFFNKAVPSAFMSLLFSAYMNTLKVRGDVYSNVVGDKETFWLASELSSAPYTFAPNYASIIGTLPSNPATAKDEQLEMCSAQPLHLDQDGKPFWFNSGLRLEKMIDSKEYVNLTHYMIGSSTTMDEQFEWRFRSHHTFCVTAEAEKWRSVEEAGLKGVVDELVAEAKKVDVRFLGHEGGMHDDGS